jgi:hypothetical protein
LTLINNYLKISGCAITDDNDGGAPGFWDGFCGGLGIMLYYGGWVVGFLVGIIIIVICLIIAFVLDL